MKNWNFSMRDGNESINFDFDSNEPTKVGSKLNDFFAVTGMAMINNNSQFSSGVPELERWLENVLQKYRDVAKDGSDPSLEEELLDIQDAIERVIDYVESGL
jgi:hypothetical protein